jgi:hypothetical protein
MARPRKSASLPPQSWYIGDIPTGREDEKVSFYVFRMKGSARAVRPGPEFKKLSPGHQQVVMQVLRALCLDPQAESQPRSELIKSA